MRRTALFAFILLIAAGCTPIEQKDGKQTATIHTEDGFQLKGSYYPGNTNSSILLLHMLGKDRHDYDKLAEKLNDKGYTVLSIDLRGHGESTLQNGKERRYNTFQDQDFRDMTKDAIATRNYLRQQNKTMPIIVGASIGANTALNYAAYDPEVKSIVLLSPGDNYHGVTTAEAAKTYNRPALIAASKEDTYAAESSQKLADAMPKATLKMLNNKGHGTEMLGNDLDRIIIAWLG